MCTVVIDVEPGQARLLAVRDEDPQRDWDDLGTWWPEHYPGVIGIRDRRAGGAWLAFDPTTRRLAVLLNRADLVELPESDLRSRGGLVLESVAGRSPAAPVRTHGFNLLEVTPEHSRVLTWDGAGLRETPVAPGVHMIAHDDLDDEATARISAWLPRFRAEARQTADATDWASHWAGLLADTTTLDPTDDRAIIRDNRVHGYPTLSLLYCTAEIGSGGAAVDSHVLPTPGHWH
ncbi:NRDE family protein [Microbacterium esteraromaticum]|uniref:NRDE family protein n=1 Tax=Microbacterium esteraromaticum TaxID=57043 RepID=UPI001A8CDD6D|nr:NRDE family protein [Microbacterium esteraromaticum]MBN8425048.1 NRDE family protein [Microbacterium esteraromaticum]